MYDYPLAIPDKQDYNVLNYFIRTYRGFHDEI